MRAGNPRIASLEAYAKPLHENFRYVWVAETAGFHTPGIVYGGSVSIDLKTDLAISEGEIGWFVLGHKEAYNGIGYPEPEA